MHSHGLHTATLSLHRTDDKYSPSAIKEPQSTVTFLLYKPLKFKHFDSFVLTASSTIAQLYKSSFVSFYISFFLFKFYFTLKFFKIKNQDANTHWPRPPQDQEHQSPSSASISHPPGRQ